MRTRKTGPDDIPALKALWKQAFGDTDAEIDSFFKTVYPEATGFCAEEDGAVIAMLFALPLALAHGGKGFYDGWMKDPHSVMLSCNDGFRPVTFLLEALDEDAG